MGGGTVNPNFRDGYENQRVLAAVEKSHLDKGWVRIVEI
jgi:hypothetical protein